MVFSITLIAIAVVGIHGYARRKALQRVRHEAMDALSNLLSHYHRFDHRARSALSLIQEIEVVSRGYDMYALLTRSSATWLISKCSAAIHYHPSVASK
jgi:hypothetical protein